jgi:Ca2+-binding RTX toxin-like protein
MAIIWGSSWSDDGIVLPAITGTVLDDIIFADAGDDLVLGLDGNDIIDGFTGNDTIGGGLGNDFLLGGAGDDFLFGDEGNDYLVGYGFTTNEVDFLTGGMGADVFVLGDRTTPYYLGDGFAIITDFNWIEGDQILVNGALSAYTLWVGDLSIGSAAWDTAIFRGDDLVAAVVDVSHLIPSIDLVTAS